MAKNSVNDYSATAGDNTDVQSVNIAEGMAPSNVNNAMREIMADLANAFQGGITVTSVKSEIELCCFPVNHRVTVLETLRHIIGRNNHNKLCLAYLVVAPRFGGGGPNPIIAL